MPDRSGGLPHSETSGSKSAGDSPELFAACHVLLRLSTPRHPPNALLALDLNASCKSAPCAGAGARRRASPRPQAPSMKTRKHRDAALQSSDVGSRTSERHHHPRSRAPSPASRARLSTMSRNQRPQARDPKSDPAPPRQTVSLIFAHPAAHPASDFLPTAEPWS
jgi:hypothetical protein